MLLREPRLLLIVRLLLRIGHRLPSSSQDLGYVRVVHIRAGLEDLPALVFGPDHEGVHWSLDVGFAGFVATRLADQLGFVVLFLRRLVP